MRMTLCGSAKFGTKFRLWDEHLALLTGCVNYNLVVYPHEKNNNKDWYTAEEKVKLDILHLGKIQNSDAIFVLNYPISEMETDPSIRKYCNLASMLGEEGYIGESTAREILYARHIGVSVFYASWLSYSIKELEDFVSRIDPAYWGTPDLWLELGKALTIKREEELALKEMSEAQAENED